MGLWIKMTMIYNNNKVRKFGDLEPYKGLKIFLITADYYTGLHLPLHFI